MKLLVILILGTLVATPARSQGPGSPARALRPSDLAGLAWRSIGPANMGGRITDLAVVPGDPATFFVAAATGGVWRTRNAGTTFEAVFDDHGTGSVGAIAVAPGDPRIVWIGTGEANARNSVSWGDGVYRSEDGGDTWTRMGLEGTRHVGAIAIHPRDPQVVFVAALGGLWGPGPERGVFRTLDGGRTWERVLALDDRTGAIDVLLDPEEPERVYAAAYEVSRGSFDRNDPDVRHGARSGIYRSLDGGDTWARATEGLPSGRLGRVGLDLVRSKPSTLYAVIETEWTGRTPPAVEGDAAPAERQPAYLGVRGESLEGTAVITEAVEGGAAAQAGLLAGDVILAVDEDAIGSWSDLGRILRDRAEGEEAVIRIRREDSEELVEVVFGARPGRGIRGRLGGQLPNVQERQGSRGFETGGVFRSDDHGATWRRVNSLTPRPFYFSEVRVDPGDAERLWVLGIRLHVSTDGGRRFRADGALRVHPDHHALWIDPSDPRHLILGNDGGVSVSFDRGATWDFLGLMPLGQYYAIALDRRRPYHVVGGLQDNGTWITPSRSRHPSGIPAASSVTINGGDGFVCAVDPHDDDTVYCESQHGGMVRVDLRTGTRRAVARPARARGTEEPRPRWNWRTPFLLSPHDAHTLYFGAHRVGRSRDRGDHSEWISGDLCRTPEGSLTALAESPVEEGLLWAGSDDGALAVSRDGGRSWTRVEQNLPGLAGPRWVAGIEACHAEAGRAWIVLDGHRSDDLAPHVYRTDDGGGTFVRTVAGLPDAATRVLRQDPDAPSVLYLGNEVGVWLSVDLGRHWIPFRNRLPTVPVHDLRVHPRDRELVAATHGRSLWIADVRPLAALAGTTRDEAVRLLPPPPSILYQRSWTNGAFGARHHFGDPGPRGPVLHYWLAESVAEAPAIVIATGEGKEILRLEGPKEAGLHAVEWKAPRGRGGAGKRPRTGSFVVTLEAAGEVQRHVLEVLADPEDRTGVATGAEVKP